MTRRVLLIGATGAFGSRLARMLARIPGLVLIITSRRQERAQALADELAASTCTSIEAISFLHGDGVAASLEAARPWLVIDASGPFQSASYDTARAAISAGAHWIDLADAAGYVLGFSSALDALARAKGVTALTGASSTPALSCAAVAAITAGWQRIDDIDIAIYPAGGSDVGRAVIDAVLSYAGAPIPTLRAGELHQITGWGFAERVLVEDLGARWRSPVATADYELMREHFGAGNVRFYAGLESSIEHLGLVTLARARCAGLLRSAVPLAPFLHKMRALTKPFCGVSGAMVVQARGVDDSLAPIRAQWRLTARDGDGPNVPVLAALALTKKLISQRIKHGASCAARSLTLAEVEAEMEPYALRTEQSETVAVTGREIPLGSLTVGGERTIRHSTC